VASLLESTHWLVCQSRKKSAFAMEFFSFVFKKEKEKEKQQH